MLSPTVWGIWNNAPFWVWPLLAVLLTIGIWATRTRNTSLISFYVLPFLALIGIRAIADLHHSPQN